MQHVEMTKQIGKTEITVLEGADIVNLGGATVDAIVNAANYGLQGGGGVCGAIFKAAGKKELKQECNQFEKICGRYRCHTGGAKVTDAFSLRKQGIKWIVHAVGPNLKGGLRGNIDKSGQDVCYTLGSSEAREALKDAYTSALSELKKKDSTAKSIVFPCISTSIFGYPRNEAAGVALEAVREYVEGHSDDYDKIILACLDEEDYKEYMSLHFFSDGNDQQKKPIVGGNVGQGQVPEIGQEVRGEEQPEPNGDDDVDQVQVPEIGQEVQGAEQLKLDEKAGLRLLKKSIEKIFEVSDKISDKIKDQVLAKACVCALSASSDAKKREDADKLKSMLDEVKELEDSKEEKSEENKSRMSDLMKFVERLKAEMDQADRDWFNEIIQGLTREMGKEADGEDSKFKKQIVAIKARIEDLKKGKEGNEKIWEGIITGGMGLVMEKYSLNKALKMNYKGLKGEVQGHLGFVGNMLRSVCNGNSCGEEVFREMSIGGLVRGEGEVLKKKWHVWGGPRYNREEYDGDENSPGKYKNDQIGAVIGVNRHFGDEKERGFVVGAFVKVSSHSMKQDKNGKEEEVFSEEKKTEGLEDNGSKKGEVRVIRREESKGEAKSVVIGICGGYIDPRFEIMMLVRGDFSDYQMKKTGSVVFKKSLEFDGKGFGVELGGMWKIRVSDKIVVGPCFGIEGSIEKYDEDKKKYIKEGEYNRALAKVGVECRAELGCGNDLRVKLAYKRILNGEVPEVKIGSIAYEENKEIKGKGIKEGQDIGEIGLGWNWEIGKVVGVHASVKYAVAQHFHDIYVNAGVGCRF